MNKRRINSEITRNNAKNNAGITRPLAPGNGLSGLPDGLAHPPRLIPQVADQQLLIAAYTRAGHRPGSPCRMKQTVLFSRYFNAGASGSRPGFAPGSVGRGGVGEKPSEGFAPTVTAPKNPCTSGRLGGYRSGCFGLTPVPLPVLASSAGLLGAALDRQGLIVALHFDLILMLPGLCQIVGRL